MLFIIKKEVKQEGMKIPKIEFDVYSKLNTVNLIKLNLSYCSQAKIDLSIPIIISENIDKINSSSGYYNDLCYSATSDDGTDITLKDRQKEFITNNKTVCQENCLFSGYNYDIQKAKCKCDVVGSSSSFANIKIDTKKLYENFVNIKNTANVNLLGCYKILFSKKGIIKNYGSFSLMSLILMHINFVILFYA